MAEVKYEFIADPDVWLTSLVFEHAVYADAKKKDATLNVAITGRLDISIACSGEHPGDEWNLYVWVDGQPIQTADLTGRITGYLDKEKRGGFTGSFTW